MDIKMRLAELAKIDAAPHPIISVYLNTRWADEHHRDRVRVFLKNEIRKALKSVEGRAIEEDLRWIEAQGNSLIEQAQFPEADGVVMFACTPLGLRECFPVRVQVEEAFVIADRPYLGPLAALLEEVPSAVVVFVDSESARLVALGPDGQGEEVALESDVPGHHRRGGWAQLAQSRYQRHIQEHRGRHFEAVAETLIGLTEANGVQRIVLAGESRAVAIFQKHLPPRIAQRVIGSVTGAKYESSGTLIARAAEFLSHMEAQTEAEAVDAVLTEAAKSRKAVAGLEETLDAVNRGAIHRLYLLKEFRGPGRACVECQSLQRGSSEVCRLCGKPVTPTDLGQEIPNRVLAAGGTVETVKVHERLSQVGGLAALLRYPL